MTLVMPFSEEDTDGDEDFRETHSFNFFEKMMNLDREIILFAVLLTSYAAVRNMNQTTIKSSQPKPFFSENPWVHDFYHGEIHKAFGLASKEDITFVMYYAPWDADCQRAKPVFEKVARYYHRQIHFMAINCWEPSSVCKAHFNKIKRYPVFMVYLQRSKGVEYQGLLDFAHMTHFLSSIITPLQRVHDLQTLNSLRSTYDAVVLAYIPFYGMFGGDHYHAYYRAALKFLEVDPRRDVAFALMTDQIAAESSFFYQSLDQSAGAGLKLYLWNSTLMYNGSWDPPSIVKWVHESTHKIATWVYPPGIKSNLLAQFIDNGPTLILFTPRNMFLSHSYEYNLLKLAALHFYDCYSESAYKDFYSMMFSLLFFISSDDQWESMSSLKHKCSSSLLKRDSNILLKSSKWTNPSLKYSFNSNFEALSNNSSFYNSCTDKFNIHSSSRSSLFYDYEFNDEFSAESLQRLKLKSDCRKLRFALKYLPEDWLINKEFHSIRRQSGTLARNLGCKANMTLSFLAMDSFHFEHFASNFGLNIQGKYAQTAAFIVDSKAEAIYHLNSTYLNLDSLEQFIHDFTYRNLTRLLRSSDTSPNAEAPYNSLVKTASSNTFNDLVINNNKTVLVYFYSPFCTYSQAVYYVYISLANTLKSLDNYISFVRIDGENNDLEWPFSIDKYPSIILLPSADKSNSKLFSRRSKITVSNLSKFVLFNLNFELRAQAHILFCLNSMFSDFHSIDGCINNFKLSSLYFISHYNTQLQNILIHHKLENYEFLNTSNSRSMHSKSKQFSVLNEKNLAESSESLIVSTHKIKCKLLYFQLVNFYLNKVNFSNTNTGSISGAIYGFYQIYLSDLNDIHRLNSLPCGKLLSGVKSLQNDDTHDQETILNFQQSKIQYRKTFESILCHLKSQRASKCEDLSHLTNHNQDEINLNENPHTNDFPFDDEKEEEILLSSEQVQKNEEISTNKSPDTPSGDNREKHNSKGSAIIDEL